MTLTPAEELSRLRAKHEVWLKADAKDLSHNNDHNATLILSRFVHEWDQTQTSPALMQIREKKER